MGKCLGLYGTPRGVGVSYERGTPVTPTPDRQQGKRSRRSSSVAVRWRTRREQLFFFEESLPESEGHNLALIV